MLSVDEALRLVLEAARPIPPRQMLASEAQGLILAEPVVSDIDSPPHDKSLVDGYALIAADIDAGPKELSILEEVTAGQVPMRTIEPGSATRIMTGAPIPTGADSVVMVEQTSLAGSSVRILQSPVKPGQNIMRRAASLARGQTVLEPGKLLRAIEVGLLAEVGIPRVAAIPRPKLLIMATGNELVDHWESPGPGQIRNSNSLLLAGLATAAGAFAGTYPIVRDDAASLREHIEIGLSNHILVLSGGVSAGVLDLVPAVLADLGVEQVFHKVNLKPGKPLWFGVKRHPSGQQTLVFGLPGNPVSGLVCFELFVRPAIEKLSGRGAQCLSRTTAALTREHRQRGDRPTYWPAVIRPVDSRLLPYLTEVMLTPLTTIIGFGERLELALGLDETERRMSRCIVQNGQALKEALEDLLRLAEQQGQAASSGPTSLVTPLPWQGSGDLRTLADANCLAYFPAGDQTFAAGTPIEVLLFN
jgi:molybdopterin molybdotransferase